MKLCKYTHAGGKTSVGIVDRDGVYPLDLRGVFRRLSDVLGSDSPREVARELADHSIVFPLEEVRFLAPIDDQEVWAAGVTYKRSQTARMEESESAASCYDRVYESPRPELFFKATPHRVVGDGQPVRIRRDAQWNVPEPEITLVLNSRLELVGFTVGNDVSSRDIEGDNPLYLPQAKVYDACCALGPWITLADAMPELGNLSVDLLIRRGDDLVFEGSANSSQMARSFSELTEWLGRDNSFPNGAFLLTGTGVVPDSDFTLRQDDVIEITITGIGTLANPVVQC